MTDWTRRQNSATMELRSLLIRSDVLTLPLAMPPFWTDSLHAVESANVLVSTYISLRRLKRGQA